MQKNRSKIQKFFVTSLVIDLFILSACEQENELLTDEIVIPQSTLPIVQNETDNTDGPSFDAKDPRYLFDVEEHSLEELKSLLQRVEEVTAKDQENKDELDIVLILHGPDINLFINKNYEKNKYIVDLAARLDAFDVIDMKICDTAMSELGVSRTDVPAFIESVPYAPTEIERLTDEGYISL